ncbi:hypothetical protein EV401DRAFT_1963667 [Pisolithus croceorrhizus]|nr:hypothetical protein EV401DRAFT_1963667 [Pisolithus croceorrhizus]
MGIAYRSAPFARGKSKPCFGSITLVAVAILLRIRRYLGPFYPYSKARKMAHDPVTRATTLRLLSCTSRPLSNGGVYNISFITMKSMHKVTRLIREAQETMIFILYSVWMQR